MLLFFAAACRPSSPFTTTYWANPRIGVPTTLATVALPLILATYVAALERVLGIPLRVVRWKNWSSILRVLDLIRIMPGPTVVVFPKAGVLWFRVFPSRNRYRRQKPSIRDQWRVTGAKDGYFGVLLIAFHGCRNIPFKCWIFFKFHTKPPLSYPTHSKMKSSKPMSSSSINYIQLLTTPPLLQCNICLLTHELSITARNTTQLTISDGCAGQHIGLVNSC